MNAIIINSISPQAIARIEDLAAIHHRTEEEEAADIIEKAVAAPDRAARLALRRPDRRDDAQGRAADQQHLAHSRGPRSVTFVVGVRAPQRRLRNASSTIVIVASS